MKWASAAASYEVLKGAEDEVGKCSLLPHMNSYVLPIRPCLQALLASVDAYMARRPRSSQPSLRPFFAAIKEDDGIAE